MDDAEYDDFGNYIGGARFDEADGIGVESDGESDESVEQAAQSVSEMQMDREAAGSAAAAAQVVLYHDKSYFPSAEDVYAGAETLVQDEDTQPLETPIIAPIKGKCFEVLEKETPPETTFDWTFLTGTDSTMTLPDAPIAEWTIWHRSDGSPRPDPQRRHDWASASWEDLHYGYASTRDAPSPVGSECFYAIHGHTPW